MLRVLLLAFVPIFVAVDVIAVVVIYLGMGTPLGEGGRSAHRPARLDDVGVDPPGDGLGGTEGLGQEDQATGPGVTDGARIRQLEVN